MARCSDVAVAVAVGVVVVLLEIWTLILAIARYAVNHWKMDQPSTKRMPAMLLTTEEMCRVIVNLMSPSSAHRICPLLSSLVVVLTQFAYVPVLQAGCNILLPPNHSPLCC